MTLISLPSCRYYIAFHDCVACFATAGRSADQSGITGESDVIYRMIHVILSVPINSTLDRQVLDGVMVAH